MSQSLAAKLLEREMCAQKEKPLGTTAFCSFCLLPNQGFLRFFGSPSVFEPWANHLKIPTSRQLGERGGQAPAEHAEIHL